MRAKRLRALPNLASVYPVPHDHRRFGRGHGERVAETINIGKEWTWASIADLSCGNAAIATALAGPSTSVFLGDYAPGYPMCGPLQETIKEIPPVDLFICSETLEHVDDPAQVLRLISFKADNLLLSTPLACWDDGNPEHVWAWDIEFVEELAREVGFTAAVFENVDSTVYGEPYNYGIWLFEKEGKPWH